MGKSSTQFRGLLVGVAAFAALLLMAGGPAEGLTPPPWPGKADLVFESGGRIVSMKADGSERKVLTHEGLPLTFLNEGDSDGNPQFSPDGDSIVFDRDVLSGLSDYENQIMVMDRDGGSVRPMFPKANLPKSENRSVGGAVWSADSSRIFLLRATAGVRKYTTEVMSIKPDGTDLRKLSGSTMRFRGEKISGAKFLPLEIAPSPDGKKLLVSYFRLFGGKPARIYRMDADTGKRKLLARDASSPSWSPDGSRITFVSERDHLNKSCYEGHCSYDLQIYVMKANGSGARRLIPGPAKGSQYGPDWSADGGRISLTSNRTGSRNVFSAELFSIRPDGKCLTRLTNGSPSSGSAVWGPEAGRSSGPGTCGDAAPRAIGEITPDRHILGLELPPMWLGPAYGNQLLTSIFKDGRAVMESYDDCGALKVGRCQVKVSVDSGPVCEKYADSIFYDGTFKRLVKRNGALVMLSEPAGRGLETIVYTGGTETGIYTPAKHRGKRVTWADHLKVVDALRPVTSAERVAKFEPPVFHLTEVQTARAVLRSWRNVGSLAEAAKKQGMFPKIAGAYLRFGKALERQGKVLTVKCKRRSEVPGSIKPR